LRDSKRRLTAEIIEYLRDPHQFLATREQQRPGRQIEALRRRLGLNNEASPVVNPATGDQPLDFSDSVVAETVREFEQALKARAREAERFIS
jgi:hypothetical protein